MRTLRPLEFPFACECLHRIPVCELGRFHLDSSRWRLGIDRRAKRAQRAAGRPFRALHQIGRSDFPSQDRFRLENGRHVIYPPNARILLNSSSTMSTIQFDPTTHPHRRRKCSRSFNRFVSLNSWIANSKPSLRRARPRIPTSHEASVAGSDRGAATVRPPPVRSQMLPLSR